MAQDPWVRNLDAFTQTLGVENAPTIFTLAKVPFPKDDDRDQFIMDLTGVNMHEFKNYA